MTSEVVIAQEREQPLGLAAFGAEMDGPK